MIRWHVIILTVTGMPLIVATRTTETDAKVAADRVRRRLANGDAPIVTEVYVRQDCGT